MIRNEKQYKCTQELAKKCEYTLAQYDAQDEEVKQNDPWWPIMRESIQNHLDGFQAEIAEYERLVACDRAQKIQVEASSLLELPRVLVKARIAAKMSQKELAELVGIQEENLKKYEEIDYQGASWIEILHVGEVLAVELQTASFIVDFEEMEIRKQALAEFQKEEERRKKEEGRTVY